MPIVRKLNQDFFKNWSAEMAYVLGYFAADGSMIKNKRGGHFIEFTSTDKCILSYVRTVVGSTHTIAERNRAGDGKEKWKPQYRLQIGSREWFTDLTALGLTQNKSNTLHLPVVPGTYFGDFVRGYFDGDGCVYFTRYTAADRPKQRTAFLALFTSGSCDFLVTLWSHLQKRGIQGGSLKKKKRGFELVFSHRDSVALYRLMYHTDEAAEFYLPRKYKLFQKAIDTLYPQLRS